LSHLCVTSGIDPNSYYYSTTGVLSPTIY